MNKDSRKQMTDSFNITIESREPETNLVVHLSTETDITQFHSDLGSLEATAEALGLEILKHNNRMYLSAGSVNNRDGNTPPDNLKEVRIASFVRQNKTNQDGSVTTVVNAFAEWAVYSKPDGSEKVYGYYREYPIFFDNNYGYSSADEMREQFVQLIGCEPEDMPLHPMSYSDNIPARRWQDGQPVVNEWEYVLEEPVTMLVWFNDDNGKTKKRLHRFGRYSDNGYKYHGRTWK